MWLLSTARTELRLFVSPESVPEPGYAVLSHVWGNNEQTFQETERLRLQCAKTGENPRELATEKIREFCKLAEKAGYRWAWADTCCIDKLSSAELSEAINSMYDYYARAGVCYVYLADVRASSLTDDRVRQEAIDNFRQSRWHKRGWTLQELLAPDIVIFLNMYWEIIGTKAQLAQLLQYVTKVPEDVLMLKTELSDISIAARMSWASERETTRQEDEAYCLMGIFGINMPTLYGEGRAAFRRLQEEIMKQSTDTSLFAWGSTIDQWRWKDSSRPKHYSHDTESDLLAPSPSAFRNCRKVSFTPNSLPYAPAAAGLPTFTSTPHGILSRVPVFKKDDAVFAALLSHTNYRGMHIALLLTECTVTMSPLGPLYDIGGTIYPNDPPVRLALIDFDDDRWNSSPFSIEWRDIYIANRPSSRSADPQNRLINHALSPNFGITHSFHSDLREARWDVSPLSAPGDSMIALLLRPVGEDRVDSCLVLRLGCCNRDHWATMSHHSNVPPLSHWRPVSHICSRDHISGTWAESRAFLPKCFSVSMPVWRGVLRKPPMERFIQISFTPSYDDLTRLILRVAVFRPSYQIQNAIPLELDRDTPLPDDDDDVTVVLWDERSDHDNTGPLHQGVADYHVLSPFTPPLPYALAASRSSSNRSESSSRPKSVGAGPDTAHKRALSQGKRTTPDTSLADLQSPLLGLHNFAVAGRHLSEPSTPSTKRSESESAGSDVQRTDGRAVGSDIRERARRVSSKSRKNHSGTPRAQSRLALTPPSMRMRSLAVPSAPPTTLTSVPVRGLIDMPSALGSFVRHSNSSGASSAPG